MSTVNEQQRVYWNEDAGHRWVKFQERLDRQILGPGLAAIDAARVLPHERVVDVGCGCGGTAIELAKRAADGEVLGVDISEPMLDRARKRAKAEGLRNISFVLSDAQTHAFQSGAYDLMFSRFGVMFFDDPVAAFTNIRRALKPGGRACFICWRPIQENPWILIPIMAAAQHLEMPPPPAPGEPGPFAFGDPDRVRSILSGAGFTGVAVDSYDDTGGVDTIDDTVEFLQYVGPLARLLESADGETRKKVIDAVRKALAPYADPNVVKLQRAMWIVRAENPA